MKKLKVAIVINAIVLGISAIVMFFPLIMQNIMLREWLRICSQMSTGISAAVIIILLIILTVLLFKRRSNRIYLSIIAVVLCTFIGFFSLIFFVSDTPHYERIEYENGTAYVYEKFGLFDVITEKFEYINWFVRGNKNLNFRPGG